MKRRAIGFVLPHFRPGGAERVVLNMLHALDRERFQPHLFLGRVDGAFLGQLPADITPVSLGADRARFLPHHIAAALSAHGIEVAYSATNAMNLALLAAPVRVRRIVSEHTPPRRYLDQAKLPWLRTRAMRWLYPRADAVAVPTEAIAHELQDLIGAPLATRVLPNPVVEDDLAPLPPSRAPAPVRLISAGRLVAAKGFDTLIDACALVAAAGVDFRLDIHGEGPLRDALQARILAAGLGGRVALRGHCDQLGAVMAEADLFVLASRREGFGNVLVEAMAAGLPVLATVSGGPETFIRDGVNGHLAEPENPLGLAAAMMELIADPAMRQAVRCPALETARGFTIGGATAQFAALVDELLAETPKKRGWSMRS